MRCSAFIVIPVQTGSQSGQLQLALDSRFRENDKGERGHHASLLPDYARFLPDLADGLMILRDNVMPCPKYP